MSQFRIPTLSVRGMTYAKGSRLSETFARMRKSSIPEEGWTFENFGTTNGENLLRDVLNVRRLAIRDNATKLTKAVSDMIEQEIDEVLTAFVQELAKDNPVVTKSIGSNLINVVLSLTVAEGTEALFEAVLRRIFGEKEVQGRIIGVFKPTYTSVMAHVANKTVALLIPPEEFEEEETVAPVEPPVIRTDQPNNLLPVTTIELKPTVTPKPQKPLTPKKMEKLITRKADKLCSKVTRISETTRKRMKKFFKDNIEGKATVHEMMQKMRDEFKKIERSRIPTIVRNELAIAANEAQILSFKNTKTLTHCSVIGCQAVEDDSPTYKGFHTCNLQNVPVDDLELVEFHINHTGSWVPSGFRKANGSVPKLKLYNKAGIGSYDDPDALRHRRKPKKTD